MDISKASNFERFVFDLLDGDAEHLKALWQQLGQTGEFDLSGTDAFARAAQWGFVSGSSSHADRLQTIRKWHDDRGVLVDTHTADGLKVAQQYREPGIPMICLETALPAKFAESIVEATGQRPPVPEALADLEHRVQRYVRMPADAALLKAYVAART
jgi:threonine synthase